MINISVSCTNDTLTMISALKNHKELKKWKPTTSDIVRVAIANYWEQMCMTMNSENKSLTNK